MTGIRVSFLRKELQPLGGCGEGWGPAVRPQRLLGISNACGSGLCGVRAEPKGDHTGGTKGSPPCQLPILGSPPTLIALHLELLLR